MSKLNKNNDKSNFKEILNNYFSSLPKVETNETEDENQAKRILNATRKYKSETRKVSFVNSLLSNLRKKYFVIVPTAAAIIIVVFLIYSPWNGDDVIIKNKTPKIAKDDIKEPEMTVFKENNTDTIESDQNDKVNIVKRYPVHKKLIDKMRLNIKEMGFGEGEEDSIDNEQKIQKALNSVAKALTNNSIDYQRLDDKILSQWIYIEEESHIIRKRFTAEIKIENESSTMSFGIESQRIDKSTVSGKELRKSIDFNNIAMHIKAEFYNN